jgi:hypothetical protein
MRTEPAAIAAVVRRYAPAAARVGLETGPLTTWLWTAGAHRAAYSREKLITTATSRGAVFASWARCFAKRHKIRV